MDAGSVDNSTFPADGYKSMSCEYFKYVETLSCHDEANILI